MEFSQCFTSLQSRGKSSPTENEVCSCLNGNNVPSRFEYICSGLQEFYLKCTDWCCTNLYSRAILCNTCEDSNALSVNTTNAVVDSMTSTAVNISEKEFLLSILDNFIRFQEERVQVCALKVLHFLHLFYFFALIKIYKEFDGTLKSLIEQNLISQYSENCIGVTAKFSLISNQVINLQVEIVFLAHCIDYLHKYPPCIGS